METNIHHITSANVSISGHYIGSEEEWWGATVTAQHPEGEFTLRLYFETREAAEAFDPTVRANEALVRKNLCEAEIEQLEKDSQEMIVAFEAAHEAIEMFDESFEAGVMGEHRLLPDRAPTKKT